MDTPSSSTVSVPGRQKRVLPSRSRRGGPGVGNCDSDVLILETYKRQYEIEPFVPLNTPFLLSTNSAAAVNSDSATEAGIHINVVANERYFARPEVLKAFREQQNIQTPEFESIGDSSYVGTRTRPRPEDATVDTSDAAYEKRHRKFETLEKRQRLREKEKLKHEHYKLKERIEQLRAMDSAAFMTLPASSFSPAPPQATAQLDEMVSSSGPYAQSNGVVSNSEGERRRKEMLETAYKLEKRYAYLLPPDRVRKTADTTNEPGSKLPSDVREGEESETEKLTSHAGPSRREESMKFRIPARSSASTTPAPSPGASKPAAPKKPRASAVVSKQPNSRFSRGSISTSAPPEQETPPPNQNNDVAMHEPDDIHLSTPAPLGSIDDDNQPKTPLSNVRDASNPATDLEGHNVVQNGNGRDHNADAPQVVSPIPAPTKSLVEHGERDVIMADDGESEKAPSEDEDVEHVPEQQIAFEPAAEPQPGPEPEPEPEPETEPQPEPEPEPVPPKPKKRGRKKKIVAPEEQPVQEQVESQEVKDLSTRFENATVAETPSRTPLDGHTHQEAFTMPVGEMESISAKRPYKRRKQTTVTAESSIRTPSAQPAESASAAPSRKYPGVRGRQYSTYTNSAGQKETTFSLLLMAAIRKGTRATEVRHTTSFGTETPKFTHVYEFELPEWLHYSDSELGSPNLAQPDLLTEPTEFSLGESAQTVNNAEQADGNYHEELMDIDTTEPAAPEPSEQEHTAEPERVEEDVPTDDTEEPVTDMTKTVENDDVIQDDDGQDDLETEHADVLPDDNNAITIPAGDLESETDSRIKPRILSQPAIDEDFEDQLEW